MGKPITKYHLSPQFIIKFLHFSEIFTHYSLLRAAAACLIHLVLSVLPHFPYFFSTKKLIWKKKYSEKNREIEIFYFIINLTFSSRHDHGGTGSCQSKRNWAAWVRSSVPGNTFDHDTMPVSFGFHSGNAWWGIYRDKGLSMNNGLGCDSNKLGK